MKNPLFYKIMGEAYSHLYHISIGGIEESNFDAIETMFNSFLEARNGSSMRTLVSRLPDMIEMLYDDVYDNTDGLPDAWLTPAQQAARDAATGGAQ